MMTSRLEPTVDLRPQTLPEAWAVIDSLHAELQRLQAQVAELQNRLNQNSTNSSKPPSSDPPHVKRRPPASPSGRKRGGQPKHRRHTRPLVPPDHVQETIPLKPQRCRRCARALQGDDPQPLRHQVAELPPLKPHVVEYQLHRLNCPSCGVRTCAALPPHVPRGHFGPRLRAVLSLWAGGYRLSKRQIPQMAGDLFGLTISTGMIAKLERQGATDLEAPVAELREAIRGVSVNMDETGWREQRARACLWVAVSTFCTVFTIAASRAGKVARAILGSGYGLVVTCDRWSSYSWLKRRQFCWAHLRRDFQAMIDRGAEAAQVGQRLLDHSNRLFHCWHRVRDGKMAHSTLKGYLNPLRAAVRADLQRGTVCGCAKTAATCRELLAHEAELWTFVRVQGIEPTNNAAERALRHAVIWRKLSGGTDSAAGSRFVERMLSVVATCRQQERNVLEYLTECYQARQEGQPAPSLLPQRAQANSVA